MAIGERGLYLPLERVIRHFLGRLFPKMEILECCVFRVTQGRRLRALRRGRRPARGGRGRAAAATLRRAVRVEVAGSALARMLDRSSAARVDDDQVYLVQGLLDLESLASSSASTGPT
jgi:polyphosphate kinase